MRKVADPVDYTSGDPVPVPRHRIHASTIYKGAAALFGVTLLTVFGWGLQSQLQTNKEVGDLRTEVRAGFAELSGKIEVKNAEGRAIEARLGRLEEEERERR